MLLKAWKTELPEVRMYSEKFIEREKVSMEKAAAARAAAILTEFMDLQKVYNGDSHFPIDGVGDILDDMTGTTEFAKVAHARSLPSATEALHDDIEYITSALAYTLTRHNG